MSELKKYNKGDIIELSRQYNPMKIDARDIELLMMELPVNGNRNKRLKDFIEKVIERKDVIGFSGGLNRIFTLKAIINTLCEV